MFRHDAQFHDAHIVEIRNICQAINLRYLGGQSGVDDYQVRGEGSFSTFVQPHPNLLWADKRSFSTNQIDKLCVPQTLFAAFTPLLYHAALSFTHGGHINRNFCRP